MHSGFYLPLVPMAYQYHSWFYHWSQWVPMVANNADNLQGRQNYQCRKVTLFNTLRFITFIINKFINKNIKMSSFKSSENIQKKEGGPDRSV